MSVLFETGMERGATLSPCGLYRYRLWRRWGDGGPVNFVMLNPSKADADRDDPTVTRCIRFAESWGYGALDVTNCFAFRATSPKDLMRAAEPIGPDNDRHVVEVARSASLVVVAWGVGGAYRDRGKAILGLLDGLGIVPRYLKHNGTGQPSHPLRLPARLHPIPMGQGGLDG